MRLIAITLAALSLSGCMGFKNYVSPLIPDSVLGIDLSRQHTEADLYQTAEPVVSWWKNFDDPMLGDLVDQALSGNLDVKIAMARLERARAIADESEFDYFPTVTTEASYSRTRSSKETGGAGGSRNNYQAGFDASWELDLFDRVSDAVEADRALTDAAVADLQNMYITVAAEVARSYIELRGAQYRLDIAERNAANQRKTYRLTQDLESGGQATALDTSRAQTQLKLTEASIPPRRAEVNAAINRLAVLTGQVPVDLWKELTEFKPVPSLPASVDVGDVTGLLARRPDIRAAERRLAASVADYNVSVTELFPVVNIVGALGYAATNLSNFGTSAVFSSVGPVISWRAFDLGRAQAEIDQTDALAKEAHATYVKTMLEALEETQTSLSNFAHELQRRKALQDAAKSSKRAAQIAGQRFRQGVDDFLDVLDTERTQLDAEDALAQSEIESALNLVAIYKALGGGWQTLPVRVDEEKS